MRILLVVHINTYFSGLFPLGKKLKQAGSYDPVLLFVRKYPTILQDLMECQKEGVTVVLDKDLSVALQRPDMLIDTENKVQDLRPALSKLSFFFRLRRAVVRRMQKFFGHTAVWETVALRNQMATYRHVFREHCISLVVLPADNLYDQAVIVKAAHLERIPVVVVPSWLGGAQKWLEYVWSRPAYGYHSWFSKIVAGMYPRWLSEYKGKKLLALPANQVLAREWLGIAPPLPWVLHSGYADAIALESDAVRDMGISFGLPPEQLVVTGSAVHDVLAEVLIRKEERRKELLETLALNPNRPILLSALPPDNIYMGRPQCDFLTYSDLIDFWCRSLSSVKDYNVVVLLHPSMDYEAMKYVETLGVKIAKAPTAALLPLCDIYVACVSATIQWAVACGKPVINYDVYRYRYTDYQDAEGVITVEEQRDFLRLLNRMTTSSEFYEELASRQARVAERWGRLDGKAAERLQNLFGSTIASYAREVEAS